MFIITNRALVEGATGPAQLGPHPNPQGPNELRMAEARRVAGKWQVTILPDELTPAMKEEIGVTTDEPVFASRYLAAKLLERVQSKRKHLLFFVHGYNNDVQAVLDRAHSFQKKYNVEVLVFTWPANGGGIKGVADYLDDKSDARLSAGALNRALAKLHDYLVAFNRAWIQDVQIRAAAEFPDNHEQRQALVTRTIESGCPFTVNLVLHSMGNYLLKTMLSSSVYRRDLLIFDNVVLVAADCNNMGHAEWVQRLRFRRRLYVTINEDDAALMASRVKCGEEQLARLGHWPRDLNAPQALYVDFTGAAHVERSHAYFEGGPLTNTTIKNFFADAFTGQRAERRLAFDAATNTWRVRPRR